MPSVSAADHVAAARRAREVLATYEQNRDLITLGAYKIGADARVDDAIRRIDGIESFLRQGTAETAAFDDAVSQLATLIR
jgi:flagellar biosynthesis/type III secretory pathway ATPase